MPSSSPTRRPRSLARAAQSSIVAPSTGTNGQTSVAPIRGCSPRCLAMSMSDAAFLIARNDASSTASGGPIRVITVRLVAAPGSTSRSMAPGVPPISAAIASMTARSRPSLKFGTHSISFMDLLLLEEVRGLDDDDGVAPHAQIDRRDDTVLLDDVGRHGRGVADRGRRAREDEITNRGAVANHHDQRQPVTAPVPPHRRADLLARQAAPRGPEGIRVVRLAVEPIVEAHAETPLERLGLQLREPDGMVADPVEIGLRDPLAHRA